MPTRDQLEKLMNLGSKKADEYLVAFTGELKKEIFTETTNDAISEKLETLDSFIYKTPDDAIEIIKWVLSNPKKPQKYRSSFGVFAGKSHKELVIQCIELLKKIRYSATEHVLTILIDLMRSPDKNIGEKSRDAVQHLARYDYHVLTKTKVGYAYQRFLLDFMKKWPIGQQLINMEFIKTVSKELLSSSVEGSSMADEKTFQIHFGQVIPNKYLEKIRKETIDLIYSLYSNTKETKEKLQLAMVLEEALRPPAHGNTTEQVQKMIIKDASYLADIYRRMIFDKSGKIIPQNIAVAEKVEERTYWFSSPGKWTVSKMTKLREDILNDCFYQVFRPLVGGPGPYKGENEWEKAEEKRKQDTNQLIQAITGENIDQWGGSLNIIASQRNLIDTWKLRGFENFLSRLSSEKPHIADLLLSEAFRHNLPLKKYARPFLWGFRTAKEFKLCDKYVTLIANKKNVGLTAQICFSLADFPDDTNLKEYVRDQDLKMLENIVKRKGQFQFLSSGRQTADRRLLHFALFNALGRNYPRSPKLFANLIEQEIRNNQKYVQMYLTDLPFFVLRKWIDVAHLTQKTKHYLMKEIVETPDFNWHLQELLINLCGNKLGCVMDMFKRRIKLDVNLAKEKRKKQHAFKERDYKSIPYHFNPRLQKMITEDITFPKIIKSWVRKMDLKWSAYNWNLSQFLDRLKADKKKLLMSIINTGDQKDLLRVSYAIESISGADFDLCMEIVKRTSDDRILGKIRTIMYATGVVSGEYGLSNAYRAKADALEKYVDPNNNDKQVIAFAKKMIDSFNKSAEEEKKRADEEIQLRKIRFEG